MRILISNDDGATARGLRPLFDALQSLGEVWLVAPERERSAQSHALTLHKPLRVKELGERWYAASGTPADCVYLGLQHIVPGPVDLVVSGINRGANLSNDVFYSGTVAAAMEGALHGVPAIAVSLFTEHGGSVHHWETAAEVARRVSAEVLQRGLPRRTLLNVNVPDLPLSELRGVRRAALGERAYELQVDKRDDPRGRPYYWIGGRHYEFREIPGTDGPLANGGYATVTPLEADLTEFELLEGLADWDSIEG